MKEKGYSPVWKRGRGPRGKSEGCGTSSQLYDLHYRLFPVSYCIFLFLFPEGLSHFTGVYRDGKALRGVMGLETYELMISCTIIILLIYTRAHAHTSIYTVLCYSFGIAIRLYEMHFKYLHPKLDSI